MCKNNCFFAVFLLGLMSNMAYADLASTMYVQDYVTAKTPTGDLASLDVVDTNHIADGAVTTGKIKNLNVTTAKIADGAVTEAKIATDAVTTGKIKNLNVTTAKIADGAVTEAKISDDAVTTGKIKNLNVTTAKIADGAVTTGKILDGTIKNADVADNAEIAQSKISGLTSALYAKVNVAQGTGNKGKGLIVNADGNLELANVVTTLTADNTFATQGSYVHDIKVEDGEIKPKSVAFDTVINTTTGGKDENGKPKSSNAPTTHAVKTYVDAQIEVVDDEISSVNSEVAAVKSALKLTGSGSSLTYSLPVATTTTKGAVIVGENIGVNEGTISVATANGSTLGVVKAGTNTSISNGAVNVATANGSTLGVVKAGTNTSISSGAVNVATATPSTLGVVKVGQIPSGSATATNYATIWVE